MDKMYGNVPVIIHADDYGETYNTSMEMLKLMAGGHLDGISLITNMRDAKRYFDMFYKAIPDMPYLPLINVHINLVEGRSLLVEGPEDSVYDTPCLAWDWGGLFKASHHIPARDRNGEPMRHGAVFDRLVKEITLQLKTGKAFIEKAQSIAEEKGVPYTPQEIRIDSHQHAHMIPIVRKAIARVIENEGLKVTYIRNSHEPLMPFLKEKRCRSLIGFIKNRILAFEAPAMERYIKRNVGTPNYLCGVMMSGHMDLARLMMVLPGILEKCRKKGCGLEINIHPAMMLETEATEEIPMDATRSFYMSTDRHTEALTVRTIRAAMDNAFNKPKTNK